MVWETADARTTSEKKWPLPAVAAALIHYCALSQIPLPRNSTKSIEVVPEGFRLMLGTRTEMNSFHSQPWRISHRRPSAPSPAETWEEDAPLDDEADGSSSQVA
jgi:hypothetical protein